MNIGILTLRDRYTRESTIWYPLIKWENQFSKEEHIIFNYYKRHEDKGLLDQDVVIIDSRYCWQLTEIDKEFDNLSFIKELVNRLKQKKIKVLLFDNSDSAGGRYFELIEYVDLHVKKQVLKNRRKYTDDEGVNSYRVFLEEYNLSDERRKLNQNEDYGYGPCPKNQLDKITLGWNIGMEDYRYFPLSHYYPIGTTGLLNKVYKSPNFNTQYQKNPYASSFRGTINHENENYSYQRNKIIELFKQLNSDEFITGGKISNRKYLAELRKSKVCVSPFGWGEVCFRDFEGIICGCVLLKPDMSHIETYPDIYKKGKTYVSLKWDMSDLEDKLLMIIENFDEYINLIEQAQSTYKKAILGFPKFRRRFMSLVS